MQYRIEIDGFGVVVGIRRNGNVQYCCLENQLAPETGTSERERPEGSLIRLHKSRRIMEVGQLGACSSTVRAGDS